MEEEEEENPNTICIFLCHSLFNQPLIISQALLANKLSQQFATAHHDHTHPLHSFQYLMRILYSVASVPIAVLRITNTQKQILFYSHVRLKPC